MIIKSETLEDFFINKINKLSCRDDTKAYIVNLFSNINTNNLSNEIICLEYLNAREKYNFEKYQNIGDWILFVKTLYPTSLNNASEDYYFSLAQSSYYKCYIMINKSWKLYEELSDNLPIIIKDLSAELTLSSLEFPKCHSVLV